MSGTWERSLEVVRWALRWPLVVAGCGENDGDGGAEGGAGTDQQAGGGGDAIPSDFGTQFKALLQAIKTYGVHLADNGSDLYFQGEPSPEWEERTFEELKSVSSLEFEAVDLSPLKQRAGWSEDSGAVPGAP